MIKHPTTKNIDIQIGSVYYFTNKHGYTTEIIPIRITPNKIVCTWKDGSNPRQIGVTQFKQFKKLEIQ